ncbi:MAG TPA: condensation domain-containing protein, partial [Mycobacteriales bacterium]|nr:condensation domain-containing protein [Mycobacteriales bacterium]
MTTPGTLRYEASYYQRDWVLACRDATSFYSEPVAWDIHGELDPAVLTRALRDLVGRHDALRTAFRPRDGDVDQLVWPEVEVELRTVDLSADPDPAAALETYLVREAERPRPLVAPPLWHAVLLRLGDRHQVLAMFIHHLVFDGWSHGVLHDELVRCVRAAVAGRPPRLPRLPLRPGEFAREERTLRDADAERWWTGQLAALPPLTSTPEVGGRFVSAPLPAVPLRHSEALRDLADMHGVGFNEALLATVVATRRHQVGDDVVLGITRASRDRPESHRVIGPLLDHLPVRVDTSGGIKVRDLLERVHHAYREAAVRKLPLGLIRRVVAEDLTDRGGRLYDTRYNYMPSASSGAAVVLGPGGEVRI